MYSVDKKDEKWKKILRMIKDFTEKCFVSNGHLEAENSITNALKHSWKHPPHPRSKKDLVQVVWFNTWINGLTLEV